MKNSKKRILIIAAIVVAVFIPTYVALISFNIINSLPEPVDYNGYGLVLTTPSGNQIVADGEYADLKEMFLNMRRDAVSVDKADTTGAYNYKAVIIGENTAKDYEFFIYPDGHGYMKGADGVYQLTKESLTPFLNSTYASQMYKNSSLPVLLTTRNASIIPTSASWKYAALGGSLVSAEVETSNEYQIHYHMGKLELKFTVQPDDLEIMIKSEDGEIYYDSVDNENRLLEYNVRAKWNSDLYTGYAEYHFFADKGLLEEFSYELGISDGEYTDFIVIHAENIGNADSLQLKTFPDIGVTTKFYKNGDRMTAVLPIGRDVQDGEYSFVVVHEGSHNSLGNITVKKRPISDASNTYPAGDKSTIGTYYANYLALLQSICEDNELSVYINGTFMNPVNLGSEIRIGYGRRVTVEGTDDYYVTDGVEYAASGSIFSLNGGKVVKTGYDEWLGYYAVIDHGLGIKSWYCHLSGTDVSEGQIVAKNETLGTAAKTGYAHSAGMGFYLIITVNGVPMSPYALCETEIFLSGN